MTTYVSPNMTPLAEDLMDHITEALEDNGMADRLDVFYSEQDGKLLVHLIFEWPERLENSHFADIYIDVEDKDITSDITIEKVRCFLGTEEIHACENDILDSEFRMLVSDAVYFIGQALAEYDVPLAIPFAA